MNADLSRIRRNLVSNPLAAFGPKEWWYSGFHDPETDSWLSFFFYRSPHRDVFRLSFFQPSKHAVQHVDWSGVFGRPEVDDQIRLEALRKDFCARLQRQDAGLCRFELSTPSWEIDLQIHSTLPPFRTGDRQFEANYDLNQRFGLLATGSIRSPAGELELVHAPGYSDHSWGSVPRRSRWHWVALQNDRWCLNSLVNVGPFAERHTNAMEVRAEEPRWIRLDPEVRFRNSKGFEWDSPWRLESTDLELDVEIIQASSFRRRIPPLVPLLVDITHTEAFVRASGMIRVDGIWRQTGELRGVLEEHSGHW